MEEALFVFLFLLIWLVVVFAVIIAVGLYILKAIAFQKLMRKFNYRKSWMAWIPFAQYYALADTAAEGKSTIKFFGADAPAWLFKFWYLFTYVAAFIPFIGPVAIAVFKVLILGNLYRTIYARAEKRTLGSRTALGIFSAIIELIPIIKFLHYDSSKVEPMEEPAPAAEPVPLITAVAPEKAAPVQAAPAFCMVCGAKLIPGAVFCSNCGTKVGSAPAAKAEPAPVKEAEPEAAPAMEAPAEALVEIPAEEAPVEVPAVVEEVKEEAAETVEEVKEAAAEVVVSAETAAEETAEAAEAAVEEAAESAAEAAEAVQEEISEAAAEAVDTVSEAAEEAAEEVAEAVESAEEVAEEAAEEIKEEA